jgi:hypothetical protein
VHAFEANTPFENLPGTQITYRSKISIAPAAPSVPHFPRFRALALFGRRPQERVDSVVIPASKNLHMNGLMTAAITMSFSASRVHTRDLTCAFWYDYSRARWPIR